VTTDLHFLSVPYFLSNFQLAHYLNFYYKVLHVPLKTHETISLIEPIVNTFKLFIRPSHWSFPALALSSPFKKQKSSFSRFGHCQLSLSCAIFLKLFTNSHFYYYNLSLRFTTILILKKAFVKKPLPKLNYYHYPPNLFKKDLISLKIKSSFSGQFFINLINHFLNNSFSP
jgi:hypothetical protein